ncbi:MAG: transcription termination/antitermination protein NusA [Chloroflexi bacterium]|nr:transcription termination/antitermination protein NusA [Chloroflexota bacterium]
MKSEFEIAITQLCADRNLSHEVIIEAIEAALASAYKRNYGDEQNISVDLDPHTGQARVFVTKSVVETVENPELQVSLADAKVLKQDAAIGETVTEELTPRNFGRIAAQTAKQVIMQRIREAERDSVYLEYADRAGEIVNGVIHEIDAHTRNIRVSLGKAEAIMPRSEQIPGENYRFNQRIRAYIVEVERTARGPQITLSRTHQGLLRRLLELEVPEIYSGTVEVKAIAREAGWRSKVAVSATQPGVDPVGSCVGMRGVRIQNIVNELNGEKIDVVAWSPDLATFISNALSPAKVVSVYMNQAEKSAKVIVPDKALSLAIGKEGQNARLAAKLTGWRIDIRSESDAADEIERLEAEAAAAAEQERERENARQAAAELLAQAEAGLAEEEAQAALEAEAEEVSPEAQPEALAAGQPAEGEDVGEPEADAEHKVDAMAEPALAPEHIDVPTKVVETAEDEAATGEAGEQLSEVDMIEADEWEEEEDEDGRPIKKDRRKRDRKRQLEFDERLGQVVARKKRRPGRDRNDWDDGEY